MRLKLALAAALIALGLCVGAWATSWYVIDDNYAAPGLTSTTYNTTYKFYWQDFIETTATIAKSSTSSTATTYKYKPSSSLDKSYPQIATTFTNCLTFLTVGAALVLATLVFQGLREFCKLGKGSKFCKLFGFLVVIAATVLLAVAFFSFLNITKAFASDQWGSCNTSYDNVNCNTLIGDSPNTILGVTHDYSWKPDVGWWLLLGALFVSFFAVGGVLSSEK